MESQLDDLREGIASKERAIARGDIDASAKPHMMQDIAKEQQRLDEILESRPVVNDKQKDELSKVHKSLGKLIGDSMFSRDDMRSGRANAHEEFKINTQPSIKVDAYVARLASDNGMKVTETKDGLHLTRNDASRVWKMAGHTIGEHTNTEYLRKDKRK